MPRSFGLLEHTCQAQEIEIPTNGLLSLARDGPTGLDYTIQTSTDLISWRDVTKITNLQSTRVSLEGLSAASNRLFYRAISP